MFPKFPRTWHESGQPPSGERVGQGRGENLASRGGAQYPPANHPAQRMRDLHVDEMRRVHVTVPAQGFPGYGSGGSSLTKGGDQDRSIHDKVPRHSALVATFPHGGHDIVS